MTRIAHTELRAMNRLARTPRPCPDDRPRVASVLHACFVCAAWPGLCRMPPPDRGFAGRGVGGTFAVHGEHPRLPARTEDHGTILEARPVSDTKGFRHAKDSKTAAAGYVLAMDVGTTTIQGIVYGKQAEIVGSASEKTALLYPQPGWVELEPEALYEQFVRVAQATLRDSGVKASEIVALGIATQRGTFCTWHRETGKPLHNLLGWQDLRASHLVKDWNHSFTFKCLQGSCKLLHAFSRQQRFQAASILRFSTQQVSLRLVWALKNIPQLGTAVREGNCCFGCIDTWLLYKLTNGQVYATDYSNASATGVFDPFQMEWNGLLCSLLSIPPEIFPPIRDTGHIFGYTDKAVLGVSVPVAAVIADQQAAMFGECCFTRGDVKLTMGTGTFVNMNTGEDPYTAVAGLYPLIGWKIGDEVVFLAEGNASDTGTTIEWAGHLGLFSDVAETADMANSVPDTDGVYFVPSFSGIQLPVNDPSACTAMFGLRPSTTPAHIVRAILESLIFRNKQLLDTMETETGIAISSIRVDGGVSNNTFVVQQTADVLGKPVHRPKYTNMSCQGAAFMAGLVVGFWTDRSQLVAMCGKHQKFLPRKGQLSTMDTFHRWEKAVERTRGWYN